MGRLEGDIPSHWIKRCLIGPNLLPFCVHMSGTPFVIPLDDDGSWIKGYDMESYWKKADGFYKAHKGAGSHTPVTLTQRLNHHNALTAQAKNTPPFVIYNTSGSRLYASVLKHKMLIDSSLYSVACASITESNFLSGMINSNALQAVFTESKKSPRHYHTYYWNNVPIPRFDRNNNWHRGVASLADEAACIANAFLKNNSHASRKIILDVIQNSGVLEKLDHAVSMVLPKYVK